MCDGVTYLKKLKGKLNYIKANLFTFIRELECGF